MKRVLSVLLMISVMTLCIGQIGVAAEGQTKELNIVGFNWGWDQPIPAEDLVGPEVEKAMGFKVNFQFERIGSYEEVEKRLQMWAASGMNDWPEVLYTGQSVITRDIVNRMGAGGRLIDWNTLFDRIPSVATATRQVSPLLKTQEDALYMLPQAWNDLYAYKVCNNSFIRKDWLEQLGLAYPTTVEALDAVLAAFKQNIQVEGGVVPYSAFGEDFRWNRGWFIPADKDGWQMGPDGEAHYYDVEEPKYLINMLTWLNRWYTEGYIDGEAFILKQGQVSEKASAGRVGLIHGADWEIVGYTDTMQQTNPEAAFVMPPNIYDAGVMEGPNDLMAGLDVWASYSLRVDIDPEVQDMLLKFLEWSMTDDGFIMQWWGIKDVHWMMNEDGRIVDTPDCAERLKGDWNARVHEGIGWYVGVNNYDIINKYTAPTTFDMRPDMIEGWKNIGYEYPLGYDMNPNRYIVAGPMEMQNTMGANDRYRQMVQKAVCGAPEDVEATVMEWVNTTIALGYEQTQAERTELCKQLSLEFE